ncbi:MAG: BMFP domain-containing protein YqiC [Cellvibrionaceae bacterium]|jgi:BMFP domain-containing protein YqiC
MFSRVLDEVMSRFDSESTSSSSESSRSKLKAMIAASLRQIDLVPRDEFDAQAAVLLRTRQLLQELEQRFVALEETVKLQNQAEK